MVFISLVMWSWLLSHIKGSYDIGIVSKSSQTSTHAQSIVNLTSYYLFQARTQEGVRGVRPHPLAGQTISKSCRFSPEAEFKHLLLASQLGFSWDSHPLYFKRKHIWHECQFNIWSSDTTTYMRLIITKQLKLFTVCTEQVRSLYIEHAASGLPNHTPLEGEVRFIQAQDQQVLP